MSAQPSVLTVRHENKFQVSCRATNENRLCVGTDSLSVTVSQRVRRDADEEMWESVGVYAQEDEDGSLVVRVLVFNPDWDEPLQIATIRSRPRDGACLTPLGCNLDHVWP
jgi:hypothetical protein